VAGEAGRSERQEMNPPFRLWKSLNQIWRTNGKCGLVDLVENARFVRHEEAVDV